MNVDAGRSDIHSAVVAAQGGSLPAAKLLVERFQYQVQAVTYLHTGSWDQSIELSESVFLRFLVDLDQFNPDGEVFFRLMGILAGLLVLPSPKPARGKSIPVPAAAGGPGRFQVDDDRSRTQQALGLLDPADRLALLLREFSGLDPADISVAIRAKPDAVEMTRQLGNSSDRIRRAANLDASQSIPGVLKALAFDAPRRALWDEIGTDVAELFARRRFRSRTLAAGAVGVVVVALVVLVAFLVYGATSEDGESTSGVQPVASLGLTTLVPSLPATRVLAYLPPGDVADLLVHATAGTGDDRSALATGLYDPEEGAGFQLPGTGLVEISPDGATLLQLTHSPGESRLNMLLTASSSSTGEELWRADVGPLADSGPNSVFFDLVVVDDLIYVASHDPDFRERMLTITVLHLDSGGLRDFWGLDLDVEIDVDEVEVDLLGTVALVPPRLTIQVWNAARDWMIVRQIDLQTGDTLFGGDEIAGISIQPGRRFLAPDGRAVLTIPDSGLTNDPSISFLTLDTMTQGTIPLPFTANPTDGSVLVEYLFTADGRGLYALAPYDARVVMVDLERRQVAQVIELAGVPVPQTALPGIEAQIVDELYGLNPAVLSPDGLSLYALGPLERLQDGRQTPGVWKIDTGTWSVSEDWLLPAPGVINSIHLNATGSHLYVQVVSGSGFGALMPQVLIVDAATGDLIRGIDDLDGQKVNGTLADRYRNTYGRSPSVDGVVPEVATGMSSIPAIDLQIEPGSGTPGSIFDVRVVLRDPMTGGQLTATDSSDMRMPAPPAISASFGNADERRAVVLGRSPEGFYTGQPMLDLPGVWNLTLTAGDPEVDGWRVTRVAVVDVVDIVHDSDGRGYRLEARTDPAVAVAGRLVDLTVIFEPFEVETTSPTATAASQLQPGLPVTLDVTIPGGTTATLYRSGTNQYSGFATFPNSGVVFPVVSYVNADGQTETVAIRVEVALPSP